MPEENRELYRKILKEKGLKVTTQRVLVLEALMFCQDRHLTAEELYELVKVDYPRIGLATVYRNIQLLLELHLIDRINLDDGFVRYEIGDWNATRTRHHHHHLICMECGGIASFQEDLLEGLEEKIREAAGFSVVNHEVKLYGYCAECRRKFN